MANFIQLEVTNFFCNAAEFSDNEYHIDRLWRSTLFLFKVKVFKLMFWYAKRETNLNVNHLPPAWNQFGETLPASHVLNRSTFRLILLARNLTIEQLQRIGYAQMSVHEVELFDQSSLEDYLKANFTLNEFILAAGQVHTNLAVMDEVGQAIMHEM